MKYLAPTTIEGAVRLLSEASGSTRILAGGTDTIVQLNAEQIEPDLIVDIKRIGEIRGITNENGGFRIGAAVSCAEMTEHDGVRDLWPGCVEAAGLIGSTQVQGRATIAGNLCNGSPAADSVPAMVAAGAVVRIIGTDGSRDVAVEKIPVGPGKTSIGADEFVHSIFLPPRPERSGDAYLRFIPRTEMDIAVVGVGINLTMDASGVCTAARVALGAVAETVLLVEEAGDTLIGTHIDDAALDNLARAVSAACKPINDKRGTVEFRTRVAGVLAKRVAKIAAERARG
ncbi:MAG: xanthine dehydrogenase family protein subunit M [Hyphomicrobiales bacterium]|nr:xanthine dehydrogenase family protein subunit M [Hyphomicrobiales bacterium]